MKRRKIIALLATLTLAMSSMVVSAADGAIVGDVNYVDTTVYKLTLPTTSGMSFKLDPQGLTSLDTESGYSEDAAGKIVGDGTMTATNLSSVKVKLSADFYIEDSDAEDPVTLVGSSGTVDDDEKQLQMIIKTTDTTTTEIGVTQTAAGTPTVFEMAAADYEFTGSAESGYKYELAEGETGSTIDMTLDGSVAKNYDWSAYTGADAKTITLNAVFKFTNEAGDEDLDAEAAAATDDYVMTANDDGSVSYTFVDAPEGDLTVFKIDGAAKVAPVTNGYIAYSNGVLSIDSTRAAAFFTESKDYTIVATIGGQDYTLTYTK